MTVEIDVVDLQMNYELSPTLAKLLLLLVRSKVVTGREIEKDHKLSADARIAIHRLRRRLVGTGVVINSRRDVGYWLDIAAKDSIIKTVGVQLRLPLSGNDGSEGNPALLSV